MITYHRIPIEYNPEITECPKIEKFLIEVFGENRLELIYEIIGYCLEPHVKYQTGFLLYGDGDNGKSTFLTLLGKFVGTENFQMIPLQDFQKPYQMVNIRDKLVNIGAELPKSELTETSPIKRMIADDLLSGDAKWIQGYFKFNNITKHIYSTNKIPKTRDESKGFFRRWKLIECNETFRIKDEFILEKLNDPKEFSGLLHKALKGVQRLREKHGFNVDWLKVKDVWLHEADPMGQFLDEFCVLSTNYSVGYKEFQTEFNLWSEWKGYGIKQKGVITRELKHSKVRKVSNYGGGYVYKGVGFVNDFDEITYYKRDILKESKISVWGNTDD